jgi:CheY-like chemotaxis protein
MSGVRVASHGPPAGAGPPEGDALGGRARPPSSGGSPRLVLVIDDDLDLRATVRDILEEEGGFSVETASNGREALERLDAGPPPDLILLDLVMPVMNGWAFMAELKARPTLAPIPVVAISGSGDNVLNSAPVCAGYLSKPVGVSLLLETVARCLARKRIA